MAKKTVKTEEKNTGLEFNELTEKEIKQAEGKKATVDRIVIKKFPIRKAKITLVGDSPLLVHAWSEKAKKAMLDAQQDPDPKKGKGKTKKHDIRDPYDDYVNAAYWLTDKPDVAGKPDDEQHKIFMDAWNNGAKFGFPVIAFKKAAVMAVWSAGLITSSAFMKRLFHVHAVNGTHVGSSQELAVIQTNEPPEFCEDMVKVGPSKVADLRYRPAFRNWKTELEIELIDTGTFTLEDIVNAFQMGGFMNGVGEWRIEKDGEFGCFHVEDVVEIVEK